MADRLWCTFRLTDASAPRRGLQQNLDAGNNFGTSNRTIDRSDSSVAIFRLLDTTSPPPTPVSVGAF